MIHRMFRLGLLAAFAAVLPCSGQQTITPKWSQTHPVVACTTGELARLRAAYLGNDESSRAPVEAVIQSAELALKQPLFFPPRGGQHNQWYQCDKCQIALKTVDSEHHQCPKCQHVYTGEPYDDVLFTKVHNDNLDRLKTAAWAYAITGDAKFADFARNVLLGYAERYRNYPYHSNKGPADKVTGGHLFEQTLNEAYSLTMQIAPAYDLIHDAPVLTAADHKQIREGLLIPMLENIDVHKAGKSNWQTWHNAGMLMTGAVLKDSKWIEKAIADPDNGFLKQMQVSVTDDGMWYENSWGYHFYALRALVETAEGARHLGIDLWSHPRFMAMFTLPVKYVMPDGTLPRFGDDVSTKLSSSSRFFECAFHASGNTALLPCLLVKPTWESVMFGRAAGKNGKLPAPDSELFPSAGHAILRSGGEKGLAAVMTFGPYGGGHGHYDKLSFVFFGLGTELGVDPGRAASQAYRLPIHKNWYKATVSHNTVLVDRKPQEGVAGRLQLFETNDAYSAALASCDAAYPGTKNQRLLVLTPDYLLVFDQLHSTTNRRFDWLYHSRGTKAVSDAATTSVTLDAAFIGGEYIAGTFGGITDGTVRVQFKDKEVTTYLTMAGAAKTEVLTGDGVGASVDDRVLLTIISRNGKEAYFAAVLEPVRGASPTVTDVKLIEDKGTVRIEVLQGTAKDVITLDRQNRLQVKKNGKTVLEGAPNK